MNIDQHHLKGYIALAAMTLVVQDFGLSHFQRRRPILILIEPKITFNSELTGLQTYQGVNEQTLARAARQGVNLQSTIFLTNYDESVLFPVLPTVQHRVGALHKFWSQGAISLSISSKFISNSINNFG
ncbi:hypothetical protein T4B_7114 [Trichinella pseudospiralis]|uniref:Uncharacterized protein n=1 Tax=Trichinella pseudospiralis TaxID=6337 RepID=A0A0V1J2S8_TRIPS|nr:hypothetical protein T4B_7114 [Trichinella pseudospiralis]